MEHSIEEIYKNAINDPTLLSTIDIESLLSKIGNNHYLEDKNVNDISLEVYNGLEPLQLNKDIMNNYCNRLIGYRVVDRICDLRNGIMIRWIKKNNGRLTNGGLLMSVKIEDKGVQLLCKNSINNFFNIRFDDCIIFQKLTLEEQVILIANF
jgi:hypothetical protein